MLDDLYQSDTDAAINDLIARPLPPKPQPTKFSAWRTTTAAPRGVAAGAAESTGFVSDVLGAFGQVAGAYPEIMGGPVSDEQRKQADQQRDKLLNKGLDYSSEGGDLFRGVAKSYMPDPATAHAAEQTVFGLTRFGSKAVGYSLAAGPVVGAGLVGADEGMTAADALRLEGVDEATRTKIGAISAVSATAGVALPIAGKTIAQTVGLVAVGGPGAFMAQQAATRQILQDAGYDHLSSQYDPLDPVGLAVSTLVPAGFGAFALRGSKARAAKVAAADIKPDQAPKSDAVLPEQANVLPERARPTPEQVDAARVELLTQHVEAARLTPPEDVVGARAHDEAMTRAMDQLARGERVEVSDVAPVPRGAPTETPEFKAWFGDSKAVKEDGAPQVLYHGTAESFDAFSLSKAGENGQNFGHMVFMTSDPKVASGYAVDLRKNADRTAAVEAADALSREYMQSVVADGKTSDRAQSLKRQLDNVTAERRALEARINAFQVPTDGANVVPVYAALKNPLVVDGGGRFFFDVNESAIKQAKDGGHDGVIIKNVIDSATTETRAATDVYVAFDPKQVKSAIGNSGAFDSASPSLTDTRFSSWADQISAAIADIRAAAKESANVKDAPQAAPAKTGALQADTPAASGQAGQPSPEVARSPDVRPREGGGSSGGSAGAATEAAVVSQRLADIQAQFPDLTVQMDGMDAPVKLSDFLEQVQREANEGTDFELGANDAPLMQVAASCFLVNGA